MSHCARLAALLLALVSAPTRGTGTRGAGTAVVIIDAGSTGSRTYLFTGNDLDVWSPARVTPGLSSSSPEKSWAIMEPMLTATLHQLQGVAASPALHGIPLKLRATAGMRALSIKEQQTIFQGLQAAFQKSTMAAYFDLSAETISGENEGLYAFLAVNYLKGNIGPEGLIQNRPGLVGVLDLGGISMQLSFLQDSEARSVERSNMFSHSWMGFGAEAMASRMQPTPLMDACSFANPDEHASGHGMRRTGNAERCREAISSFIWDPKHTGGCTDGGRCKIGAAPSVPKLPGAVVAVSAAFFAVNSMRLLLMRDGKEVWNSWPAPSVEELRVSADFFCALPYQTLSKLALDRQEWDPQLHEMRCFQVNYVIVLLSEWLGIEEDSHVVSYVRDINGQRVEWALGAFLAEGMPLGDWEEDGESRLAAHLEVLGVTFVLMVGCGLALWHFNSRYGEYLDVSRFVGAKHRYTKVAEREIGVDELELAFRERPEDGSAQSLVDDPPDDDDLHL